MRNEKKNKNSSNTKAVLHLFLSLPAAACWHADTHATCFPRCLHIPAVIFELLVEH